VERGIVCGSTLRDFVVRKGNRWVDCGVGHGGYEEQG
jgi:hypothetical protein